MNIITLVQQLHSKQPVYNSIQEVLYNLQEWAMNNEEEAKWISQADLMYIHEKTYTLGLFNNNPLILYDRIMNQRTFEEYKKTMDHIRENITWEIPISMPQTIYDTFRLYHTLYNLHIKYNSLDTILNKKSSWLTSAKIYLWGLAITRKDTSMSEIISRQPLLLSMDALQHIETQSFELRRKLWNQWVRNIPDFYNLQQMINDFDKENIEDVLHIILEKWLPEYAHLTPIMMSLDTYVLPNDNTLTSKNILDIHMFNVP